MTVASNDANQTLIDNFHRYRKAIRIDISLFLAIATGAIIMNGYAHLEKFYMTLDVPIDRMNFSLQKIAAYGGASLSSSISSLLSALALVGFITIFFALMESPDRQAQTPSHLPVWLNNRLRRAGQLGLPIKLVLALLAVTGMVITLCHLLITLPSNSGRISALKTVTNCYEHHLVYANTTTYDGCLVAESDDTLYLIKRISANKEEVTFKTFQLLKAGLEKAESNDQTLKFQP